ncbi:sensor histidine kinase [Marinicella rhabdoformis]|uniref:sensor histidine kinase n=1 Tax=Marinicella rhabdoformis TaxID=2580566 RepID=UPI0012AECD30|nr:histidine kinase [Marinicella rhabdoformis]
MNKLWLADFSDTMRIFTVIVVTEMMVVVYSLSFLSLDMVYLNQLAVLSLLAQLIAITLIIILSKVSHFLNRYTSYIGLLMLTIITIVLTSLYTQILAKVDHALGFELIENANLLNIKITLATLMTLMALLRYFYVQDQWAWQVKAHADAEINALQARIKPHFLYNSLNSIASLIAIDGSAAEKAVLNLSSLFRKAFSKKQNHVPLRKELEWVNEYLAIEKLRFADRLMFESSVDESLLEIAVPVLSLQPLIENAILHGIEPASEPGSVKLVITRDNHAMIITVSNPFHENHQSQGTGTAVENIKKRLKLSYGSQAQLNQKTENDLYITQMVLPL